MRAALDTNILAYAEGVNGADMKRKALELIEQLPEFSTFLPVQSLAELFHLLVRKAAWPATKARHAILSWRDSFPLIETSEEVLVAATDLAIDHRLSIWDALILSAAAAAGCRLVLSEDWQNGFTWRGVTVINPFSVPKHELLSIFLSESQ